MSATAVIEEIRRGGLAIVTDDADRENEGDLIAAADAVDTEKIAFFLEHTSGVLCVSLTGERCDQLALPAMVEQNSESQRTAFTVSTDARTGVTTGISAADRARTINLLGDPRSVAEEFVRPGHVFPLRSRPGGVLERAGHTEVTSDLARLAGRNPSGVLCEVTSPDKRRMANGAELRGLADRHRLPICSVADIVHLRMSTERLVEHRSSARIPTEYGAFTCHIWASLIDGTEHVTLVKGDVSTPDPVLTRLHSECLTGDVFGSARCDCGRQLADSMAAIAAEGRGVVVYLRGHEGRGIGLSQKLAAYSLQEDGLDTVEANLALGLPVDARDYGIGAQILRELGVSSVRLMTNNPLKSQALSDAGLEVVQRAVLPMRLTAENRAYLDTKRIRMGHLLPPLHQSPAEARIVTPERDAR